MVVDVVETCEAKNVSMAEVQRDVVLLVLVMLSDVSLAAEVDALKTAQKVVR